MQLQKVAEGQRVSPSPLPAGAPAAAVCGVAVRQRRSLEDQSLGTFCPGMPAGVIRQGCKQLRDLGSCQGCRTSLHGPF